MTTIAPSLAPAFISESSRLVRESANELLAGCGGLARMRKLRFTKHGFDRMMWKQLCDMGWLGMRLPEEVGGSAMTARDAVQVAIMAGRHLLPEPLIGGMTAALLLEKEPLAQHLRGERIFLAAWQESANSLTPGAGATHFVDGRLTGVKRFVWQGSAVDGFVVSTIQECVLVAAGAVGMELRVTPTQDGGHWVELHFNDVEAVVAPGKMASALEEAILLESGYLLGSAQAAFSITLEYMASRHQFGKPIGSFQALQHRAADLQIALALCEASVENAACVLDAGKPMPTVQMAVSRAKARACDTALLVTRQAVQLHGAIGYTDEYDVGLFLRSAMCHATMAGSAAVHRERFGLLTS